MTRKVGQRFHNPIGPPSTLSSYLKSEDRVTLATEDLRYLLSRSYNRESAVRFVGDKYQLSKHDKLILYRCVYSKEAAEHHRLKLVGIDNVRSRRLVVDGYNVLITVESMLQGKTLVFSDDHLVRDVSAVHGKHSITKTTEKALELIFNVLSEANLGEATFFLDAQVSRSGELASLIRRKLKETEIRGDAFTVKQADVSAWSSGEVVATSDSALISKVQAVFDLAGKIIRDSNVPLMTL